MPDESTPLKKRLWKLVRKLLNQPRPPWCGKKCPQLGPHETAEKLTQVATPMTMTLTDPPVRAVNSPKIDYLESKNEKSGRPGTAEFGQVMSEVLTPNTASPAETTGAMNPEASPAEGQVLAGSDPAQGVGLTSLMGQAGGDFLKAVHWGPHLNVITPETTLPDEQSLEAFARSQGLDETAVQWLMGTAPVAPVVGPSGLPTTITGTSSLGGLTVGAALGQPASADIGSASGALAGNARLATPEGTLTASQAMNATAGVLTDSSEALAQGGQQTSGGTLAAPANSPPEKGGVNGSPVATDPRLPNTASADPAINSASPKTDLQTLPYALSSAALWAMGQTTEARRADDAASQAAVDAASAPINFLASTAAPAALWMLRQGLSANPTKDTVTPKTSIALSEIDLSQVATPELLDSLAPGSETVNADHPAPLSGHAGHRLESHHAKTDPSQADTLASPDGSATQRSEKVQALAEKMGQAVGQRILSEIEKGQWHLKLSLRPATLGHIEVEMRMRSGEMDAVFTAPQALTRELLQEGMSKLKDTLSQMGMNVASMQVGDGQTQQRGGESTPGQMSKSTQTDRGEPTSTVAPTLNAPRVKMGQDGWDVLV